MRTLLSFISFVMLLAACNNEKNKNPNSTENNTTATPAQENIPTVKPVYTSLDANVSRHVSSIFDHYIHVKTALVNSNAAEAKKGAEAIVATMKRFDKSLLPAEQKQAYDEQAGAIRAAAGQIAASGDIEKQREHFANLSNAAYQLAKKFSAGKPLYHEHCPMAFNDKGAMWLSESKDIRNPYYGDQMLECGTVEEVIEK